MDDKFKYVFQHYSHLMNQQERWAYKTLVLQAKGLKDDRSGYRRPSDPQMVNLENLGLDEFALRTAQRIMADHPDKVFFNHCPRCQALARTPRAGQCRFCGHDWHHQGDPK